MLTPGAGLLAELEEALGDEADRIVTFRGRHIEDSLEVAGRGEKQRFASGIGLLSNDGDERLEPEGTFEDGVGLRGDPSRRCRCALPAWHREERHRHAIRIPKS